MIRANFWPTPEQALLLTAALAKGAPARDAWLRWESRISFDHIDAGSQRLVALLLWNLAQFEHLPPPKAPLKGFVRQAWFNNQRLLDAAERLLVQFERAGIPTLVLKGIPLALHFYPSIGTRPMLDIDLAVPHSFADQARHLLIRQSWSESPPLSGPLSLEQLPSLAYRSADGLELDLHFSFFHECCDWRVYEPIWEAAETLSIGQAVTRTLCPADMLLHTFAHGARVNSLPPIRWIADAVWILRATPNIDWDLFVARASAMQLELLIFRTLSYLADHHDAVVPDTVLKTLGRRKPFFQRLEFRYSREGDPPLQYAALYIGRYVRGNPGRPWPALVAAFPNYLRTLWQTKSFWQTGCLAFRKMRVLYAFWRSRTYQDGHARGSPIKVDRP